jgi:hypothetical protein
LDRPSFSGLFLPDRIEYRIGKLFDCVRNTWLAKVRIFKPAEFDLDPKQHVELKPALLGDATRRGS